MIIKGADINTFTAMGIGSHRKNGAAAQASGNKFAKRFDTFELSDLFKNYDNAVSEKASISDIKQMLSAIKDEDEINNLTDGIVGYEYMLWALVGEAMRTQTNALFFSAYSEEKEYYQSLLNEADGIRSSDTDQMKVRSFYDRYEYKHEGGDIDRDKVEKALANVQSKIDDLLNNTMEHRRLGERTTQNAYNNCARAFAGAFGVDGSDVVLDENSFNKMFGKIEATEENYIQKCKEKSDSLWECYRSLRDNMSNSLKRIARREGGDKIVSAIRKAMRKFYGDSYKNGLALAAEAGLIEEENEKTE